MILFDRLHWPHLHWKHGDHMSHRAIGITALCISICAGSTFNAFAKSLGVALSPFSLLFISEILTAFFVLFSFGLVPTVRRIAHLHRKSLLPLLMVGVFSGILAPFLWFTGLNHTTAVNAGLFGRIEIIFLILMAHFVLKERFEKMHAVAMAFVFFGLIFTAFRGFQGSIIPRTGDLLIILAAGSYALGNITFRKFLPDIEPHLALFARSSTAIVAFFLISPFLQQTLMTEIRSFPLELIPALLGFAFISRFINSVMFYQAIDYVPVTTVSLIISLELVGSIAFSNVYLGEAIRFHHLIGALFIISGNVLLAFVHPKGKHEEVAVETPERVA